MRAVNREDAGALLEHVRGASTYDLKQWMDYMETPEGVP